MMKIKIGMLIGVFVLVQPLPSCLGQESPRLDEQTVQVCNEYILNIYQEILQQKDLGRYKELALFGEDSFFKNKYGIYAVVYQFGKDDPNQKDKRKTPYKIAVTVVPEADPLFNDREGFFESPLGQLGLKVVGYQKKHLLRSQYDFMPLLQKHSEGLLVYQQRFLPLRLKIISVKEDFQPKESILFDVILSNVSKYHMLVDSLGQGSLYFTVNGREWGTQEAAPEQLTSKQKRRLARQKRREARAARKKKHNTKEEILTKKEEIKGQKILRAGEALTRSFLGESFLDPKQLEIKAYYRMKLKGINPYSKMIIRVTED